MQTKSWVDTATVRRATSRRPGREERRREIVEAAVAAIEADGPQALTAQIADRAGLARTHVYRHFASKEDLHLAVARRVHRELAERIRATLSVDGTPLDVIRAPVTQHVLWAAEHPNLYRFLVARNYRRSADEPRVGGSAFASEISSAASRYIPAFGIDPLAADRVVAALVGLIDASVRWWLVHHDSSDTELIERLTTQAWLLVDNRLCELGIELDPNATLQPVQAEASARTTRSERVRR